MKALMLAAIALTLPPIGAQAESDFSYHKGFLLTADEAGKDDPAVKAGKDRPFQLKAGARVQARYTLDSIEAEPDRDHRQNFSIARARLKLSGKAFTKKLGYTFQTDFGKGNPTLKDFFVTYQLQPKTLELTVGQFKRAYSRQQLISSGSLEQVDRSIIDKALPTGRDIGISIGSDRNKAALEWSVGVFNGTGDKAQFDGSKFNNVPADFLPAAVVRVGYNHGGIKGYSEADLEGGGFRMAVAANLHSNLNLTIDAEDPTWVAGIDALIKVQGFSALIEAHRDDDAATNAVLAQFGYVIDKSWGPAARFALVQNSDTDAKTQQIGGGVNVFLFGARHNAKLQLDGSVIDNDDGADNATQDFQVRTQFQLAF